MLAVAAIGQQRCGHEVSSASMCSPWTAFHPAPAAIEIGSAAIRISPIGTGGRMPISRRMHIPAGAPKAYSQACEAMAARA